MSSTVKLKADVIIIGSGVAGALCAYRLAKQGVKVLVLEAGPRIKRSEIVGNFINSPYQDLSAGYPNTTWAPRPNWSKGNDQYIEQIGPEKAKIEYLRNVGGTTWHWNASTIRLLPQDMKLKSNYGVGLDWPISYSALEPYYAQAEIELGVAGSSTDKGNPPRSSPYPMKEMPPSYSDHVMSKKLKQLGINFTARPVARNTMPYRGRSRCQGFGTCMPICPSGAQYNAMVHVELAEREGAQIIDNSRVDRLDVSADQKINIVHASKADGTKIKAHSKIFILAAHAIESPRLLLMSANENFPNGLANSSSQLGRNFFTHLGLTCDFQTTTPVYSGRGPNNNITSYENRDGKFRKDRASWIMSLYNSIPVHDIILQLINAGIKPPELDKQIRHSLIHNNRLSTDIEQLPEYKNGMRLNWQKKDSAGQPQMQLYFSIGDYEKKAFKKIRSTYNKIVTSLDSDMFSITQPFTHDHPMGMTRMGTDPKTSVVDQDCRSHDHPNLFVISSSVFPTGGTANPTLTIAALSLRASKTVLQQLLGK